MSEGKDLYIRWVREHPLAKCQSRDELVSLLTAAELFRNDMLFFSAGLSMSSATYAAFGTESLTEYFGDALSAFKSCVESNPPDSLEALAALSQWRSQLWLLDPTYAAHWKTLLAQETAQRLINFFGASEHSDSYLVRGFILATDLDGGWEATFPDYETRGGSSSTNYEKWWFSIDSAFHLLIGVSDYVGAHAIAQRYPEAFTTYGLKGWALAVEGFVNPKESVDFFAKAADVFAQDVEPSTEEMQKRSWDAVNVMLWAKYFSARALVASIPRKPTRAVPLLREASEKLKGTEAPLVDPQVNRFRLLVNALLELLEGGALDVDRIRRALRGNQLIFGETSTDPLIEQFADSAAGAFEAFRKNPALELTRGRLHMALEILGRMPFFGQDVAHAMSPVVGQKALGELLGTHKTWIYRTLEGIKDERQLQRIVFRLEQAQLPRFAQIRHGPLEYGKDVVAVIEKGGRNILRMWQAKIGDINVSNWRMARAELEEMYLVPLASLQIPVTVDERQGILVCNGHGNINVEPVMEGWIHEQRKNGRQFEFMHIDGLVNWIVDQRLINEFRTVLTELGISPNVQ